MSAGGRRAMCAMADRGDAPEVVVRPEAPGDALGGEGERASIDAQDARRSPAVGRYRSIEGPVSGG